MAAGRHHERGFTLIEMIIVLILLALAMAAIFPAVANMMRSSGRTAAMSQGHGEARLASVLFEDDLRAAVGARGTGDRNDHAVLSMAATSPIATVSALNALDARQSDIVVAGPLQLTFNADVLGGANAGPERVTWQYVANSPTCGDMDDAGRNWCVQRVVRAQGAGALGGGILTAEVAVRSRGTLAPTTSCLPDGAAVARVRVFCYQEALPASVGGNRYHWSSGWSATCERSWLDDAAGPNRATLGLATSTFTLTHNGAEPATRISRLDRIVTVGASLQAGAAFGNAAERSYENVTATVRARESEAYQEAIMCGMRAMWGG